MELRRLAFKKRAVRKVKRDFNRYKKIDPTGLRIMTVFTTGASYQSSKQSSNPQGRVEAIKKPETRSIRL